MRAGPAALRFDWSRDGLSMDLPVFVYSLPYEDWFKDVSDRSAIMVCDVKFGAKILPAYSPLDMKVGSAIRMPSSFY